MTTHVFPALGFDPVPGEPDQLEQLGASCNRFGAELDDDAQRVRELGAGFVWVGPAAAAFRGRLDHLPRDLERTAEAYREAGRALLLFSGALRTHQARARDLEAQAAEQRRRAADPALRALQVGCPAGSLAPGASAESALAAVLARAHRLRELVLVDAGDCNRRLREATRHAPRPAVWFTHLVDLSTHVLTQAGATIGAFVRSHAGVIAQVAGVASAVSSALAVVAMIVGPIPVLGQAIATVAVAGSLIAGGIALAGHSALALYAGGGWSPVLFDAVALATAGAGKGVEAVGGKIAAAKGLDLTEQSFHGVRGALAVLRHPTAAWTAGTTATLTFPSLVTRAVSYQFDLAAGGLGTFDLARSGQLPQESEEAKRRADRISAEHAARGLSSGGRLTFRPVGQP